MLVQLHRYTHENINALSIRKVFSAVLPCHRHTGSDIQILIKTVVKRTAIDLYIGEFLVYSGYGPQERR